MERSGYDTGGEPGKLAAIGMTALACTLRAAFSAVSCLLGALVRCAPDRFAPPVSWPAPSGSSPVGVRDVELVDLQRAEPRHPGQPRRLMARLWYPASSVEGLECRQLIAPAELDAMIEGMATMLPAPLLRRFGKTPGASYANAPALQATSAQRSPVLIFSHGLGGVVWQNTHLCEHLASHGYVVVSLAHPHAAAATIFPDGSRVTMTARDHSAAARDVGSAIAGMALLRARNRGERLAAMRRQVVTEPLYSENQTWATDVSAAITLLSEGKGTPAIDDVLANCDFTRVGAFGMSFGGSASASAAAQDARIRTVVNLDGGQRSSTFLDAAVPVPLLALHSKDAIFSDGSAFNDYHYEPLDLHGLTGRVTRYRVPRAGHLSFTDMTLLGSPFIRRILGTAGVEGPRMLALIAELTQRFFDRELRQRSDAFPGAIESCWPELQAHDAAAMRAWAQQHKKPFEYGSAA